MEEETYRRDGKGRRCCWGRGGGGIHSIPCRTTDLAPGCFEEKDEKKNGRSAEWMLQKKSPIQHPPNMDVLPKTFLYIIFAANWLQCRIQVCPPKNIDDLCLIV